MIWGFRNLDRYGGSEDSRRDCCVKRSRAGCKATQAGEATKFVTFWWALNAGFGRRCIARPGRNRLMQQCPLPGPRLIFGLADERKSPALLPFHSSVRAGDHEA